MIIAGIVAGLVVGALLATYLPKYLRWRDSRWDRAAVSAQFDADPILGRDRRAA
jgi:hypothetical protein